MESSHNVRSTEGTERQSPPTAPSQDHDFWLSHDFEEQFDFDAYLRNQHQEELHFDQPSAANAAFGPDQSQDPLHRGFLFPEFNQSISEPYFNATSTLGQNVTSASMVNGDMRQGQLNAFQHSGDLDQGQTNANASLFLRDPNAALTLPHFRSPDPVDRNLAALPNSYNNLSHLQYSGPSHGQMSGAHGYSAFGRNTDQSSPAPTHPPIEATNRPRRRRRASTDSMQISEPVRLKRECAGCAKAFNQSKDPDLHRCTRCYEKHVKHTAGPTTYIYQPRITIDEAWKTLYPTLAPIALAGDDVCTAKSLQGYYVRRLIEAISVPYLSDQSGTKEDQQRVAQQSKLNKKPFDSTQYRDDKVNARVQFLFVRTPSSPPLSLMQQQ